MLTYIFSTVFIGKYNQIEDQFKEEFYKRVQEAYKGYMKKYGLYKDIKENIPNEILEFFKFEDIVGEVIESQA